MARLTAINSEYDNNALVLTDDTSIPGIDHVGILVYEDSLPVVYHNNVAQRNAAGGSILRQSLDEFLKDRKIVKTSPMSVNIDRLRTYVYMNRAKRYNVFNWNCEDFINEVLGNEQGSPQRKKWLIASLAFTVFAGSAIASVLHKSP